MTPYWYVVCVRSEAAAGFISSLFLLAHPSVHTVATLDSITPATFTITFYCRFH